MTINFQHLRAFHAIALEQGVSRAARRLNVSQPTLSKQLKALEDRYQLKLIEGTRPPLSLTPAGESLLKRTTALFGVADEISLLLGETKTEEGGTIRLGTDSPPQTAEFMAAYLAHAPETDFKVTVSNAQATNELLLKAQIDVAIVCEPFVHSDYVYAPLYSDTLVAVVHADWDDHGAKQFDLLRLQSEVLLIREPTSRTLSSIKRILSESSVEPARIMEMHTREMIREAIANNIGISLMLRHECPPDPRIRTVEISSNSKSLTVNGYLAIRGERKRLPAIRLALTVANAFATARGLI
nr:LysR substrate-binding domain-containing protein [uncultured Hyphomonas sp.]